jgi:ABC-2 type transport system permease protein
VVSTPTPFALVLVPMTCALATLGVTSLVATLAWGRLVFGIEFGIENPVAFAVAVAVTMLSIALVGFLLSVSFVRYRTAWALGNLLEYPGWLLCGFLVPLQLLPDWAATFGRALPPTWGMSAVRAAAAGDPALWDAAVCLLLALAYAAVATLVAESLLRSARRNATLSLT